MMFNEKRDSDSLVDAIDDGKIVQVTESYARREGLLILRRPQVRDVQQTTAAQEIKTQRKELSPFETFRRPLRKNQNNVLASLLNDFRWIISTKRKERNMTRRQLAQALGVSEFDVKSLENGVLPADDYILISKVEKYFSVNLRKDAVPVPSLKPLSSAPKSFLPATPAKKEETSSEDKMLGDSIQLIDED